VLLAQAVTEAASWAAVVASVANVGFAVTTAIYLMLYGIPRLQLTFEKAINEERSRADQRELRREADSKEKLVALTTDSKERLGEVLRHCERECLRRDATMTVIDKSLTNVGEVLEEVRDELRRRKPDPDDTPPSTKVKNA